MDVNGSEEKNVKGQFINKDIQDWPLIFSPDKVFSSLLFFSSHYSHAEQLKSSWLFQKCICGSKEQITLAFHVINQVRF